MLKKISAFCSLLYTVKFGNENGIIAMTKKALAVENSYFDFLFLDVWEKARTYRMQALCYGLLLFSSLFFSWYLFFKEPSVNLYLQAKKEHALFQKSVQEGNLPSIDALSKSLPSLLKKDSSLLQRYGFSTLQLLLIAEKQEEASAFYSALTSSVPSPYLSTTLAFRKAQWQLQEQKKGELLENFISSPSPSETAAALTQLEAVLLQPENKEGVDFNKEGAPFIQKLAHYFSEGAVTLQQFLDDQAHLSK